MIIPDNITTTPVDMPIYVTLHDDNSCILRDLNIALEALGLSVRYEGGKYTPEGYVVKLKQYRPFGVTWANSRTKVCQTGFIFSSLKEAQSVAIAGPLDARANLIKITELVSDKYLHAIEYALIEDEEDEEGSKNLQMALGKIFTF